jgi:hypothetical protein
VETIEHNAVEQLLVIPKPEHERRFQHWQEWWRNLLWRSLTSHLCKYGALVFTDSFFILPDQALYYPNLLKNILCTQSVLEQTLLITWFWAKMLYQHVCHLWQLQSYGYSN